MINKTLDSFDFGEDGDESSLIIDDAKNLDRSGTTNPSDLNASNVTDENKHDDHVTATYPTGSLNESSETHTDEEIL